jgi:hypothetical protein
MMSIHNLVLLQEKLERARSNGMLHVQVTIEDCDNLIKASNELIKLTKPNARISSKS